jgi:hypothetical protein
MKNNVSVWDYYQPNFVAPEYAPYLRRYVQDRDGNTISINTWEKQGCGDLVAPELVRANKGMTFQKLFESDPCPTGFKKAPMGYCVEEPLRHQPVFYTDKAFIAKRQFWEGYTTPVPDRISEQFDMRSVNPLTGQYDIPYLSVVQGSHVRYSRPFSVFPEKEKFDHSWNLPRERQYRGLPTGDSYLA